MKYLPLVWKNLLRKKTRTIFTVLSILVAFVLFGFLSAIKLGFSLGVDVTGADRLVTMHKVSLIQLLPESYQSRIAELPGVVDAAHATWFGGYYQDPRHFFAQTAVEPERFLRIYPEYVLPEEQKQRWFERRMGAIAGRKLAERYGWKVGDRIPIQSSIWAKADGGHTWEFTLEGIYEGARKGVDETQLFFQYDYFDEARAFGKGMVGWYMMRIDDPENAAAIAERIDREFANSRYETRTATEKAFVQAFAKQIGDIGTILGAVLTAVFFTILLVAGNTMAQAVRERTAELAVLKALGFSDLGVIGLVLAESLLLAGLGGGLGLGLGWLWIQSGDPTGGFLAVFYFPVEDLLLGVALAALLGLAAGVIPALRARRLNIVEALRSV
jgi:putative ABC transport system permease protein